MHAEHADEVRTNQLSERIILCAFRVLNTLGAGFLKKVHENALAREMRKGGLAVAQEQGIAVYYVGIAVGEYVVDLPVEGTVLIEVKAGKAMDGVQTAPCMNL